MAVASTVPGANGRPEKQEKTFQVDEGPRTDTSLEALANCEPSFMPMVWSLPATVRKCPMVRRLL